MLCWIYVATNSFQIFIAILFSDSAINFPKADEVATNREVTRMESSSLHHVVPHRSQSFGDHAHRSSHNWKDFSTEVGSRTSDLSSSHLHKDMESEHKNSTSVTSSFCRDETHWENIEVLDYDSEMKSDSKITRQLSGVFDQESQNVMFGQEDPYSSRDMSTARKLQPHTSPEDLSLYYKDPQGQIQGPFSGSDLIGWFEAGYFGIDLQVRLASALPDSPFSLLGDVMPHLRAKARPPPGFGVSKQSHAAEAFLREKIVSPTNIHAGLDELEFLKNGQRNRHNSATESQSQFLESFMSGSMNSSPLENFSIPGGL